MKTLSGKIIRHQACPRRRHPRRGQAAPLAKALDNGRNACMEITFRTPAAAEAIARISREVSGMLVGAGTC
ncbi:MAG: hypothetical protein ACLT8E_01410 [Akkermansia sp.]